MEKFEWNYFKILLERQLSNTNELLQIKIISIQCDILYDKTFL